MQLTGTSIAAAVLLLLAHAAVAAQGPSTVTWTGRVSTEWFDAGNWEPAIVPGYADAAVILGRVVNVSRPAAVFSLTLGDFSSSSPTLILPAVLHVHVLTLRSGAVVQGAASLFAVKAFFETTSAGPVVVDCAVGIADTLQVTTAVLAFLPSGKVTVGAGAFANVTGLLSLTSADTAMPTAVSFINDGLISLDPIAIFSAAVHVGGTGNFTSVYSGRIETKGGRFQQQQVWLGSEAVLSGTSARLSVKTIGGKFGPVRAILGGSGVVCEAGCTDPLVAAGVEFSFGRNVY
jgi:hypothetical protein